MNRAPGCGWSYHSMLSPRLSRSSIPFSSSPPCPTYQTNTHLRHLIKTGDLATARHMFDETPHRDSITWTTLITAYVNTHNPLEALSLFSSNPALAADPFAVTVTLKACALRNGQSLHAHTLKSSLLSSVFVASALLDMYSRNGNPTPALTLFDEMPQHNTVSWTTAITTLVRAGRYRDSLKLFSDMGASATPYDSHTYAIALKACADAGLLTCGREIHAHAAKLSIDSSSFVANSLVSMYCKCGLIHWAMVVFERMREPDVIAWTTVISTYVQMGRDEDAILSFQRMTVKPNAFTYAAVVAACTGHLLWVKLGEEVHARVVREGFAGSMSIANALVTMYARAGRLASAEMMFGEMLYRDVVSWTSIIAAYCQEGLTEEAFAVFRRMRWSDGGGPRGNEFTLASLLSVCAGAAVLGPGQQLHAHALAAGLEGEASVASSLITMYSKCGSMGEAGRVFNELESDDVVSWTAMINGYAEHGRSREAIELFDRMPATGLSPDYVTLIGVLTACGHAGLVDYGLQCFERMKAVYKTEPGREHYGCMVDLLGRAGRLAEAELVIESMPAGAVDEVVWTALLRACAARGDAERGQRAAQRVLELDPGCAGAHIAISNVYAAQEMWVEAAEMRKAMRDKGARKKKGCSWVELAGEAVVVFVAGERSYPRGEKLKAMLELVAYGAMTDLGILDF